MMSREELLALKPVDILKYIIVAWYANDSNALGDFETEMEEAETCDDREDIIGNWMDDAFSEALYSEGERLGVPALSLYVQLVHSLGGGEGDGEYVERVFAIKDEKDEVLHYLRITGYYSSYSGTDWDDKWVEVEPYEVVVTKYKKKKVNKNG